MIKCDSSIHSHNGGRTLCRNGYEYDVRFPLKLRWPKVYTNLRAARCRFAARLNRYPGCVIGAEVQFGRRAFGLLWGKPGRSIEVPC